MTSNDLIGLIISCSLGLLIVVISVLLLMGKGSFLIAGYNTMTKAEKEKYDSKALCKFMGKIFMPIGIFTPAIAISDIYKIDWIPSIYALGVIVLVVFAAIYCNTGNRFRK